MIILVVAVVLIGGGAGWYFKVYRPEQQGVGNEDEYEPPIDDSDNVTPKSGTIIRRIPTANRLGMWMKSKKRTTK